MNLCQQRQTLRIIYPQLTPEGPAKETRPTQEENNENSTRPNSHVTLRSETIWEATYGIAPPKSSQVSSHCVDVIVGARPTAKTISSTHLWLFDRSVVNIQLRLPEEETEVVQIENDCRQGEKRTNTCSRCARWQYWLGGTPRDTLLRSLSLCVRFLHIFHFSRVQNLEQSWRRLVLNLTHSTRAAAASSRKRYHTPHLKLNTRRKAD